jgi:uncharacterized protein
MIPQEQVVDIRNALTFLETLPHVHRDNIGLWGTSFGGANVAYVGAVDRRVACTVSVVAVGNGERWIRSLRRAWEWRDLKRELEGRLAIAGDDRTVTNGRSDVPHAS